MKLTRHSFGDLALRILAVVAMMAAGWVAYVQSGQNACMREYVEKNAQSSVALRQAAAEDRGAVDAMVSGVLDAHSAADSRAALEQYRATRKAADEKRRLNPAPPPPSELCG